MTIQKLVCALLMTIAYSSSLHTAALSPQPALPAETKKLLDAHSEELTAILNTCKERTDARMGYNVYQKEWLPGYYIKYGLERVRNAQKVKDFIEKHKLHLLCVPEKYIYQLPGTVGSPSNDNCLVIVKAIEDTNKNHQKLTREHVKQLCTLALNANHYDLHPKNYINKEDGTLCIIDTDIHAMPSPEEVKRLKQDWIKHGTRIHNGHSVHMDPEIINHPLTKLELHLYSKHCRYDQQAYEYIVHEVKKQEALRLQPSTFKRLWQIGATLATVYGMYKAVPVLLNTRWIKIPRKLF